MNPKEDVTGLDVTGPEVTEPDVTEQSEVQKIDKFLARDIVSGILPSVYLAYQFRKDNQQKSFLADRNVQTFVDNLQNSGLKRLPSTLDSMKFQNMSLTAREAVLKELKLSEGIVQFQVDNTWKGNALEFVSGVLPIDFSVDMKDIEKNIPLENQNNVKLGNTLPQTNSFTASSHREVIFSTARIDDLSQEELIYNAIKPAASQGVIVEHSGTQHIEHSHAIGFFDPFLYLLFLFCVSWISALLSKKLRTGNN